MNSKKGVSAVVATVLIIMITVAAVGIIWAAIIPMVRNSIDRGTACFDAQSDVSLVTDGGYTCIKAANCTNGTTNVPCSNISLQVKKGPNTKVGLVAIEALVFVGGNSVTYRLNGSDVIVIDAVQSVGTVGALPGSNEFKTMNIWGQNIKDAVKVKIAPVVTVGKTEEVCEATQEVVLPNCS